LPQTDLIGLYFTQYEYYKLRAIHLKYTPIYRYTIQS